MTQTNVSFVHVEAPKDPKGNFAKTLKALAETAKKAQGVLLTCFRAACFYLPQTADFAGKNADSIKTQKSRIMTVAKTAKMIGADAANYMLDTVAGLPGRQHENITKVAKAVRVKISESKAGPEAYRAIIDACVKSQAASRAYEAQQAAKTDEQRKAERNDDKKADKADEKAAKTKDLPGFAVMIGNSIEYGRDLPASKSPEEKKFVKETIDALVALMLIVQNRGK